MTNPVLGKDVIAGIAGLALSIAFFSMSFGNSGGAETFPRIVSVLMAACSAGLLLRGIVRPVAQTPLARDAMARIGVAIAMTVGYVIVLKPLGYLIAGLIFVPATAIALGLRSYATIAAATIFYVVGLYLLFTRVFHTPLPPGLLSAFS